MQHFAKLKPESRIYNLSTAQLTKSELYTAVSLQGIVAQTAAAISLNMPADFRQSMEEKYHLTFVDTDDLWGLVSRFADRLHGIVVYEDVRDINKACMVSAAWGYLAVEASLVPQAQKLGLKIQCNASAEFATEFDAFLQCRDRLCRDYVCHQLPENPALRDYAIAVKAPMYCGKDEKELDTLYDWVKDTGAVIGWYYDEVSGVGRASEHGLMTLPSDHAWNLSLHAALPAAPQTQKPYRPRREDGRPVHYVTFLLSDGDNVQVHLNSYRTHNFASKQRGKIPFGWTTSPSMYDIAPLVNSWYYDRQTENDNFLAAVSGVGYCNPALLPQKVLPQYAALSADYMKKSGIVNTVLLMDVPEERLIDPDEKKLNNAFAITEAFAAQDGIEGGFLYYGNLYCPIKTPGAVFWNHGKPFNAIRETLWHDGALNKQDYMRSMAARINSYAKDPTVPEGYTAINVQYWQYTYDEVVQFVSMLDKDVVVVTPAEYIRLMTENVADKTTKLYLEDSRRYGSMSPVRPTHMEDLKDVFWWEKNRKVITEMESHIRGLRVFGYNIDKKARVPLAEHYHRDTMEITYVSKGMQIFEIDDKEYQVLGGEIFVTFPNEPHSTGRNPQGVCEQYWMQVELRDSTNFLGLSAPWDAIVFDQFKRFDVRYMKLGKNYAQLLSQALYNLAGRTDAERAQGYMAILGFLNRVLEGRKKVAAGYSDDIQRAIDFIEKSVKDVITFEQLSEVANLSVSRFKRKFNEQVGVSPMAFHNALKIQEAKQMIKEGKKIIDIAFELNFSSSSHFSAVFKKQTSMSPTDYRKQLFG